MFRIVWAQSRGRGTIGEKLLCGGTKQGNDINPVEYLPAAGEQ
jgi:hypothetical protein